MRCCSRLSMLAAGFLLVWPVKALLAAEPGQPSATEQKLRDSLRNTILQLRTSENEKAALQATQAESDEKIKTLGIQNEELTKRINEQKVAADKVKADLEAEAAKRDTDLAKLKELLAQSMDDDKRVTGIAQTEKVEIGKLQDQVNGLNRRVTEQQAKNAAMFKIANEILQRYEKFGLGDALSAREPFTGITRVKLQGLFEDYQDKLVDQRIKPADTNSPEVKPPATPNKTAPLKGSNKAPEPKAKP